MLSPGAVRSMILCNDLSFYYLIFGGQSLSASVELDCERGDDIITLCFAIVRSERFEATKLGIGVIGNTSDSESLILGSSPRSPTLPPAMTYGRLRVSAV